MFVEGVTMSKYRYFSIETEYIVPVAFGFAGGGFENLPLQMRM